MESNQNLGFRLNPGGFLRLPWCGVVFYLFANSEPHHTKMPNCTWKQSPFCCRASFLGPGRSSAIYIVHTQLSGAESEVGNLNILALSRLQACYSYGTIRIPESLSSTPASGPNMRLTTQFDERESLLILLLRLLFPRGALSISRPEIYCHSRSVNGSKMPPKCIAVVL